MSIYYFDLRDEKELVIDKQGTELSDVRAAHDEAARGLAGVAWDAMRLDRAKSHRMSMEVRNAQGPVMEIKFCFEIKKALGPRLRPRSSRGRRREDIHGPRRKRKAGS